MESNDHTDDTLGGGRINYDADDAHNRASGSIKQQQIDKDCQKCIKYLKSALEKVGSRPHSLLHALGVISHTNINNNESKVYEPTSDGVLISLENNNNNNKEELATNSSNVLVNLQSGKKHDDVSNINNVSKQQHIVETTASSNQERKEVTLARRITKVAEYMLNNDGAHSVLTTSPTANAQQSDIETEIEDPTKKITTIAIECMKCGTDTRAESGARAYVRGPEPLSIVLCSNRLGSQREVDEVLVHELVHIYGEFCLISTVGRVLSSYFIVILLYLYLDCFVSS